MQTSVLRQSTEFSGDASATNPPDFDQNISFDAEVSLSSVATESWNVDICGPVDLTVVYQDQDGDTAVANTFMNHEYAWQGTKAFHVNSVPSDNTHVGDYSVDLSFNLNEYPDVIGTTTFKLTVLDCEIKAVSGGTVPAEVSYDILASPTTLTA